MNLFTIIGLLPAFVALGCAPHRVREAAAPVSTEQPNGAGERLALQRAMMEINKEIPWLCLTNRLYDLSISHRPGGAYAFTFAFTDTPDGGALTALVTSNTVVPTGGTVPHE